MKPSIFNAFNDTCGSVESSDSATSRRRRRTSVRGAAPRDPTEAAAVISPMQADLREVDFGWSLELSPMRAVDALDGLALHGVRPSRLNFLVNMEQSAWRDGDHETPVPEVVRRLAIPVDGVFEPDLLVMDRTGLRGLVAICLPTRVLAIAVDGPIEIGDARAMNRAIDEGRSPLLAELRAVAALEVLGDRSVVLHCRQQDQALAMVAENFRHYLAALCGRPMTQFAAPEPWQIQRLFDLSGTITVRPIETERFSTSIDVGVNTSRERFSRPADCSLVYDIPSNSWHDQA